MNSQIQILTSSIYRTKSDHEVEQQLQTNYHPCKQKQMTSGIQKILYYNKNIILQILVTQQNNETITQEDWKDCAEVSAL